MRLLCFHGGATNSEHFKKVIYHLRQNLEADGAASFHFVDGLIPTPPSINVEYQCPPPTLRFFAFNEPDGVRDIETSAKKIGLGASTANSPEDAMRIGEAQMVLEIQDTVEIFLDYVSNIMEEEGPFDGVIGASEGAGAAATVLLYDQEVCREKGTESKLKCGIFFVGFPPFNRDATFHLADRSKVRIEAPTCHIIGQKDPLAKISEALWNVCDERTRVLVDHEQGHIIPHEPQIMARIADFVRKVGRDEANLA
ncbi:MAG: hypothetical protein MMC33_004914 [Icmadophila ericetorum]|nr:hypothetical protein [Icmadophila ericetorum]